MCPLSNTSTPPHSQSDSIKAETSPAAVGDGGWKGGKGGKGGESSYLLTVRPLPDDSDPGGIRRLRRLLKAMVRSYGLRCVAIVPAPEMTTFRTSAGEAAA